MNSPQDKAEMIQIMKIPIRKENFHYQNYMKTKKNKSIEQKSSKSNLLTSIMKIFIKIFHLISDKKKYIFSDNLLLQNRMNKITCLVDSSLILELNSLYS